MLLSAGAHLSRYLVQIAIGHYFRGHAPFIKSAWVRSMPFPVFTYFLKRAGDIFGEIPADKGADDGAVVGRFVSEGRLSSGGQQVKWEDVQEIMEKYKVCIAQLSRPCRVLKTRSLVRAVLSQSTHSHPHPNATLSPQFRS